MGIRWDDPVKAQVRPGILKDLLHVRRSVRFRNVAAKKKGRMVSRIYILKFEKEMVGTLLSCFQTHEFYKRVDLTMTV
jgi:hypothetical protein